MSEPQDIELRRLAKMRPDQLRRIIIEADRLLEQMSEQDRACAERLARAPRARDIAKRIAESYGLTIGDLLGGDRCREISHPRQHAMWEIRQRTKMSLPAIGRIFGGRHHTTVLDAVRAHEARFQAARQERAA